MGAVKLELLASAYTSSGQRATITDIVANLEHIRISELMSVLAAVDRSQRQPSVA
jgi:hypothetical protein